MGLLFIPSSILPLYKLCKFSHPLSHNQRSNPFTYFPYRKSLVFNKLMYLLGFIL